MKYKLGFGIIVFAFAVMSFTTSNVPVEKPVIKLALLKYSGGGDWYANPTALPNLAIFCNIHMTGHGNVVFSDDEAQNLRTYLLAGGFLHIDDNYGMDPYVRPAMKKAFPELEFIELPFNHPIYKQTFQFDNGVPKIHKHDDKPSVGYGLIFEGRLICYYTYETDLGDGWEDQEVHNDKPEDRLKSLQMGANIVEYAFTEF